MEIFKSNDRRKNSAEKKPRYKNIIHLWEFLLELLADQSLCTIISWSRKECKEFILKNPAEVAKRWGMFRGKKGMTYQNFSRALRFYYGQGIIQKVPSQTFTYKFNKLPYKYEPGVTRSLHHGYKMAASIHERVEITPDRYTPSQINAKPSSSSEQPAFPPSGAHWGNCISWSSELPVRMFPPSAQQLTPQNCNDVNLYRVTLPVTVPLTGMRPGSHTSTAKSIPVSVIKRVTQIPTTDTHLKATYSSVCVTGEVP